MKTKTLLSITTLLAIAFAFVYYIFQHLDDFKQLTIVNPILLLILIVFLLVNYFFISIITKSILTPLGVYLRTKEAFALSIVTGFYNLITPFKGGMATRAIYLKKKHNFTYTDFLASLAGMYVITFLIASLIGIISSLLIYRSTGVFSWIIFGIFCTMFFPLFLIVIFSPKFPFTKNDFLNRFIKVVNGWNLIKNDKKTVLIVSIISISQLLLGALMLYLQFQVFGIEIEFINCLFLASIGSLAILIAITPAGLGINEAVTVFSALTIGITPTQSLSVVLLGRAIQMVVLFIFGPVFSVILIKQKPNRNGNMIK